VWSRDGAELFYVATTGRSETLMAVDVELATDLRLGPAREILDRRMTGTERSRSYDVAPDGRFLILESWVHPPQPVTEVHLVLNWFEELKRLVPTEG
jgi:hypothetical protein